MEIYFHRLWPLWEQMAHYVSQYFIFDNKDVIEQLWQNLRGKNNPIFHIKNVKVFHFVHVEWGLGGQKMHYDHSCSSNLSIVSGRYRFLATYLARVMMNTYVTTSPHIMTATLTTLLNQQKTSNADNDITAIRGGLVKLQSSSMSPVERYNIMDAAFHLTVSYYLFGQQYTFANQEALRLIERGICHLRKRGNYDLETCIDEPLVAYSLYHYFRDHQRPIEDYILQTIGGTSFSPQSQGIFFERYLIPCVIKYLSSSPTLADHPYFQSYRELLPEWTTRARVFLPQSKDKTPSIDSGPVILHAKGKKTLPWYYSNPDKCDVFVPEFAAKHDAVFSFIEEKNAAEGGPCRHLVVCQWKLAVDLPDPDAAIATTDCDAAYTLKDSRTINRQYKKRRIEADEQRRKSFVPGRLRILFTFPWRLPEGEEAKFAVDGEDIFMVLDKQRTRELFEEPVWRMLVNLKLE